MNDPVQAFGGTGPLPRTLLVCGHPRSGTTWTQLVLGAHPATATGRETHFVPHYIWPLYKTYKAQTDSNAVIGLPHYLDEDTLIKTLVQPAFDTILRHLAAATPDAELLIEKTPRHVEFLPFIHRLAPPSLKVLHVIRDPRAVYASMQAAATQDWGAFGRKTPREFATRWAAIMDRRARANALYGPRYREVHYEALRRDPQPVITDLLAWLDLPATSDQVAGFIAQNSLETLRQSAPANAAPPNDPGKDTRPDFFRSGKVDGWRSELSAQDITTIEQIAGPQMRDVGYALSTDPD